MSIALTTMFPPFDFKKYDKRKIESYVRTEMGGYLNQTSTNKTNWDPIGAINEINSNDDIQRIAKYEEQDLREVNISIILETDRAYANDELTKPIDISALSKRLNSIILLLSKRNAIFYGQRPFKEFGNKTLHGEVSKEGTKWKRYLDKLNSFQSLEANWDGYSAPAPSAITLDITRVFFQVLKAEDFQPNRLAPSVIGGVGFTFRKGKKKAYVEFSNKGTAFVLYSDGEAEPKVEKVGLNEFGYSQLIGKIKTYLHE